MNVALGTYYAWSVFVPALEREFGWTRTQTSLVPTIDMVMVASMFLVAGFLQRRIGPRRIAAIGGALFAKIRQDKEHPFPRPTELPNSRAFAHWPGLPEACGSRMFA